MLLCAVIRWLLGLAAVFLCYVIEGAECRVTTHKTDLAEKQDVPKVLLSVSSLASHATDGVITERLLELNWFDAPKGMDEDPASWVGLFDHDPADGTSDPLEIASTRAHPEGYYRTTIQFGRVEFSAADLSDRCLGYWIGYVNLDKLMSKSCLRARPHWMHDMRNIVGNRTLLDLMIPGTHNAGSYEYYKPERNTPMVRYQMCQEDDVWTQLVFGNRFLDLRVSHQHVSGTREKFWITHGIARTNISLRDVISQVKKFLDNTNEIVIMDLHHLYLGFIESWVEERHKDVMNMIVSTLGNYMIPASFEFSTLNEMWKMNKRLIVGYAAKQGIENNLLHSGVFHLWGNKQTRQELEKFLERTMCHFRHSSLWSAMAELTPTVSNVLVDKFGGLRVMAQDVNRHVTKWFKDRWWKCANIIATDFFLGNNIIDVAIDTNRRKWQRINAW